MNSAPGALPPRGRACDREEAGTDERPSLGCPASWTPPLRLHFAFMPSEASCCVHHSPRVWSEPVRHPCLPAQDSDILQVSASAPEVTSRLCFFGKTWAPGCSGRKVCVPSNCCVES